MSPRCIYFICPVAITTTEIVYNEHLKLDDRFWFSETLLIYIYFISLKKTSDRNYKRESVYNTSQTDARTQQVALGTTNYNNNVCFVKYGFCVNKKTLYLIHSSLNFGELNKANKVINHWKLVLFNSIEN